MLKRAFSIVELITVIVIISILATLALSYIAASRELLWDDQAKNNLKLIRAAERVYRLENPTYYPAAGSDSNITTINQNLGLSLQAAASGGWNYQVWSSGCSRATRNGGNGRSWFFTINDADNIPNSGAGCP